MDSPFPPNLLESIEQVLHNDSQRKVGQDIYPAVFNSAMMFPLQRQRELAYMMQLSRAINPTTVFEIGSDKGGGLYHWCKCLPTVKNVIACEIRGTPYRDLFERAFPHINFLWLDGVSSYATKTVWIVREWLNRHHTSIDALFIDGDKTAFAQDFATYLPTMRPGGVVFMHDIRDPGPREAYAKITADYPQARQFIDTSDADTALQRQEAGLPPANPHEGWLRHWKGQSCGVGVIQL